MNIAQIIYSYVKGSNRQIVSEALQCKVEFGEEIIIYGS
jgi:hypothetical protein